MKHEEKQGCANSNSPTTRREFIQRTVGLAAGTTFGLRTSLQSAEPAAQGTPLPTIKLGPHAITRLIIGGNPIYGHSHFNRLLSQHQTAWHTPQRVVSLLQHCEQNGINTWQNSYDPRTLQDLEAYRAAGGKMHWLCLGKPDWAQHPERIDDAAHRGAIGIAPHGALAERLHRQGKLEVLQNLLKRIRDQGVLVGLSAHNPALIQMAEEQGWDVDYYMCSLYYLTRPRAELKEVLGEIPLGEIYLPSDPARMFEVIQRARKPCLAYKILAAGRRIDTPAQVRQCFETALSNIKPSDAVIVGMYQQFNDQVAENAALVRELHPPTSTPR
jgi:hypothetical protein